MRGFDELRAMRRRGVRPRTVFIDVCDLGDAHEADDFWARYWTIESPHRAHLHIAATDHVSGLDLRCVIGMPVLVQGESESRVRAVGGECIACGARSVVLAYESHGAIVCEDMERPDDA